MQKWKKFGVLKWILVDIYYKEFYQLSDHDWSNMVGVIDIKGLYGAKN